MVSSRKFVRLARQELRGDNPQVYMLMCVGLDNDLSLSSRTPVAVVKPEQSLDSVLPIELHDFQDVFQVSDRPAPINRVEHEIETTANLLFGLIYNLSSCELAILHTYLDSTLERG